MAGVLLYDPEGTVRAQRPRPEHLGQVAYPGREELRSRRPRRIGLENLAVRLQVSATAGGVDDDLRVAAREGVDVVAGELAGAFAFAGVRVERAAAGLLQRHPHDVAVPLEHPNGRPFGFPERFAHDASVEERGIGVGAILASEPSTLASRRERPRPTETPSRDSREARQPETSC